MHPIWMVRIGAAALLALAVSGGAASAQEPAVTATVVVTASAEPTGTPATGTGTPTVPTATNTPATAGTPAASTTPTAGGAPAEESTGPRLEQLDAHLDELEAALGDLISDETSAAIVGTRKAWADLIAFGEGLESGDIHGGSHVEHEFQEMVKELRGSLNDLMHAARTDAHGLTKGGNGGLVADLQHDLHAVKKDVDIVVRQEKRALKVVVRERTRGEPSAAPAPAASSGPTDASLAGVPGPSRKTTGQADDHDRAKGKPADDDRGRGRQELPTLPRVAPIAGSGVAPAPAVRVPAAVQPRRQASAEPAQPKAEHPKREEPPRTTAPRANAPKANKGKN